MYVGIDIGGTKTLIAVLNNHGEIKEEVKLSTDKDYEKFLDEVRNTVAGFHEQEFQAGGAGIPVTRMDRDHGRALVFSNLPWKNVPIRHDLERIFHCPVVVENDAKLAALSEYMLLRHKYKRVLYVTVSTGIGYALVDEGIIDTEIGDGGGRTILLEHKGKLMPWEDFASGRAIVERYGKKAKDIEDEATWKAISRDLAKGFIELIAVTQPDVIVVGGGVGHYFEKFRGLLKKDIEKYKIPMVKLPDLKKAQRPDEAVVYGCYDIARQKYPHAADNN